MISPKLLHALASIALLAPVVTGQSAPPDDPQVSAQGILLDGSDPLVRTSPRGGLRVEVRPLEGDFHRLESVLRLTARDGSVRELARVRGNGFLPTERGSIVTVETLHSMAVPSRLAVIDLEGRELHARRVRALTDPTLSADGLYLAYRSGAGAYRSGAGIVVLDLETFEEVRHPNLSLVAAGPGGVLAGVRPEVRTEVVVRDRAGTEVVVRLAAPPRRMAFSEVDASLLVLTARELLRVELPSGRVQTVFAAPSGGELRDLRVYSGAIDLGLRRAGPNRVRGELLRLGARGQLRATTHGPVFAPTAAPIGAVPIGSIPWPLLPNVQHPVGNTYGEFQDYGGSPYMHPGVDVLGDDDQPVYAVRGGVVKAILTTSGSYHWRVAIGDAGGSGTTEGYLYAHIDEPTIAVNLGDVVSKGQYLGNLVPWPVSGFTHCHFARVEDSGAQWFGAWLCTENPHVRFYPRTEVEAPVFEPATGSDLFAFATNQSSTYQDPDALKGKVDIVAHVADRIVSGWWCSVQEIRYSIYPLGSPHTPVVDDRLAVVFDMHLDTYQGGPFDPFLVDLLYKEDSTCDTDGDYGSREFFHIVTNSDGDQVYETSDLAEAWDTALLSDGDYVVEVTAIDAAGNSKTASMTVTTDNGNP